ncbi:alpha/beta fold hydrolase [Abyssisolibacter fermentans]|uniref:alpha/beta fold hydrolase n=1 Tax=Abyssisolibacter fermentans TaxID=1766203 RepID=UPI00082E1CA7|nr:alpha/beta hydrolase [Abyssisolibacter fermentans]
MFIECSDGVRIYVEEKGKGQKCMFIHGGPGAWCENFKELAGEKFEKTFSMIYFDQRGCGRSEGNKNTDYSLDRLIDDIEEIRKKLGIKKLTLLAHSFGGIIAVKYAIKFKENVDSLILMNVSLDMIDSLKNQLEQGMKLLNITKSYKDDDLFEEWNSVITTLINKGEFYKFYYNKEESNRIVDNIDSRIGNRSMAEQAFSNNDYFKNYTYLTSEIEVPTLVITGREDYAIGPNHYKKFKFPNCKIEKIDGKHGIYIEQTDELISAIKGWNVYKR